MDFDDEWVDEVNRGLKACSVFCWYPIYCGLHVISLPYIYFLTQFDTGLTYNQLNNNLTSQAATMSTHGLPNDVLSNLDPFALIIFIPICDVIVCVFPMIFAETSFNATRKDLSGASPWWTGL